MYLIIDLGSLLLISFLQGNDLFHVYSQCMDLGIYVVLDVNSIVIWALQESEFVGFNLVFIP